MKTQEHNFSLEDWERHKKGSAGKELEKILSGNDLNYLSSRGFEKAGITAADVTDVIRRIDAKTFSSLHLNSVFIGGIVVVAFVSAFVILSRQESKAPEPGTSPATNFSLPATEKKSVNIPSTIIANSTGEKTELKKPGHWQKEHFAKIEQPYEMEIPAVNKTETVDMTVTPVRSIAVENNSEINVGQLPNAPVIYHVGLKVTNYHLYYFKNNQPFQLENGGLGSEFEGLSDYTTSSRELNEGKSLTADEVLREAVEYFAAQDYSSCLTDFDILLKLQKSDVNANFYSGMSYYLLGKPDRAIGFFDHVLNHPNNIFHQEAEYYKALSLLNGDQASEGMELLKKIAAAKGFYSARARELMTKKKN